MKLIPFLIHNFFPILTNSQIFSVVTMAGLVNVTKPGHFGFYISENERTVTVLGGNQRGTTGSTGAVVRTWYAKTGRTQELHSFRSVPA